MNATVAVLVTIASASMDTGGKLTMDSLNFDDDPETTNDNIAETAIWKEVESDKKANLEANAEEGKSDKTEIKQGRELLAKILDNSDGPEDVRESASYWVAASIKLEEVTELLKNMGKMVIEAYKVHEDKQKLIAAMVKHTPIKYGYIEKLTDAIVDWVESQSTAYIKNTEWEEALHEFNSASGRELFDRLSEDLNDKEREVLRKWIDGVLSPAEVTEKFLAKKKYAIEAFTAYQEERELFRTLQGHGLSGVTNDKVHSAFHAGRSYEEGRRTISQAADYYYRHDVESKE